MLAAATSVALLGGLTQYIRTVTHVIVAVRCLVLNSKHLFIFNKYYYQLVVATYLVVATQQHFGYSNSNSHLDKLRHSNYTLSSRGDNNNSLVLSSTARALWSKPKMRKIRTTASFYGTRDERGRRTRSHTGSSNARSDGARH